MVGSRLANNVADDDEQFDTQALFRLSAWGLTALVSIVAMVIAARSDLGVKRVNAGLMAIAAPPDETQPPAVQLLARAANAEREARRAVETAMALASDRERMATKVMALERDIGDINGTVARAVSLASETRSATPIFSMSSSGLLAQYKTTGPPNWTVNAPAVAASVETIPEPKKVALVHVPSPRTPAPGQISPQVTPQPAPSASPPSPPQIGPPQTLAPTPAPEPAAAAAKPDETATHVTGSVAAADSAPQPKAELGVDLGPGLTVNRLRSRWTKISAERPDLVKGLRPVVAIRDMGAGKPVEIRLVIGPLANVNSATEFCTALASQQHVCRPAVFDGQRLNVQ